MTLGRALVALAALGCGDAELSGSTAGEVPADAAGESGSGAL